VIRSEQAVQLLINALLDPARKLPVIALSVSSTSSDPDKPSLDAVMLAKACAGLALVVVIPAQYSLGFHREIWQEAFCLRGCRPCLLPGFTEDANPFGGHQLILSQWFSQATQQCGINAPEVDCRQWECPASSTRYRRFFFRTVQS